MRLSSRHSLAICSKNSAFTSHRRPSIPQYFIHKAHSTFESSASFSMVNQAVSSLELDPTHTSCIGGKTVLTCRSCAGNAPRYVALCHIHRLGADCFQKLCMQQLQWTRLQHLRVRTLQPSCRHQSPHVRRTARVIHPRIAESELVYISLLVQ
ncbi:uncharacterized protein BJX67DRAFT_63035 [Aspergillus lucknowensis]|uniref:Uncharacterized protein n=1 Tax=Aspergillus lucknowensis TaxID=176173 RepID=A0ABR4LUF6_9EURO